MKPLSNKSIVKESHNLNIMVFEKCVIAEVTMPLDLYFKILQRLGHGRFDDERYILSRFTQDVFQENYERRIFFSSHEEFYTEAVKHGIDLSNSNSNKWFRMVLFPLTENNYEKDIKNHIDYIKQCSERYVSNTLEGKTQIAKKYLDKL